MIGSSARAVVDGFEVASGYNSTDNQTVIGLPSPGTDDEWNGPWDKQSGNEARMVSSSDYFYEGSRSLKMENSSLELSRPVDSNINGGLANPKHWIDVYAYVPSVSMDSTLKFTFYVSTASNEKKESAAFQAQWNSTDGRVNWYVWDGDPTETWVNTGVAVATNTWVHLLIEMDMMAKTYTAYVEMNQVASATTLDFGDGAGSTASTTNITAVGFNRTGSSGTKDVYFDALGIRPRVPEVPSWIAMAGFLMAGVVPVWLRRRMEASASG
ncbi:MAG: LamG-like jellyroll fold domain-containing protein [Verrucomicrobiota bacterium]